MKAASAGTKRRPMPRTTRRRRRYPTRKPDWTGKWATWRIRMPRTMAPCRDAWAAAWPAADLKAGQGASQRPDIARKGDGRAVDGRRTCTDRDFRLALSALARELLPAGAGAAARAGACLALLLHHRAQRQLLLAAASGQLPPLA